jgi:hypothetical protein
MRRCFHTVLCIKEPPSILVLLSSALQTRMSLFGDLNSGGIRGPDVVINGDGGSLLPTTAAGVRFSEAQINKQSELLSGLNPYHFGPGSTSDDITYQVVPHKIQKIVPQFLLPSSSSTIPDDHIKLSHSVDDGDVAFTIRMVHDMGKRMKDYNFFSKQNITRAVDPIINLPTVNYILRGLQTDMGENSDNWGSFLQNTGWPITRDTYTLADFRSGRYQHRNLSMFIQDYIRPLGVVIGSEHQGGQHQGVGGGAVDFPVDFVVTILVDGLCDNMLNLWRRTEIRAGDDMFLALCGTQVVADRHECIIDNTTDVEYIDRPECFLPHQFSETQKGGGINMKSFCPATVNTKYVLNHWAKGQIEARFEAQPKLLFELVPTTSTEIDEGWFLSDDRRNRGLWHIARSQVHIRGSPMTPTIHNQTFRQDTANLRGGGLVQSTIAPVWKAATRHHTVKHGAGHAAYVTRRSNHSPGFYSHTSYHPFEAMTSNTYELPHKAPSTERNKRPRTQKSVLEDLAAAAEIGRAEFMMHTTPDQHVTYSNVRMENAAVPAAAPVVVTNAVATGTEALVSGTNKAKQIAVSTLKTDAVVDIPKILVRSVTSNSTASTAKAVAVARTSSKKRVVDMTE